MANTLRFKRGLASGIPTGVAGEPLFTTDTFDLYIGNGTTNTRFQKYIASGASTQLLRGDGSLLTMPIVLTSPANGEVLKYNGTSWVNDSDAGITGSGSAGQVAYFTDATTQAGSNNLFWDNTNGRLGIGTNTPATNLAVLGTAPIIRIGGNSATVPQLQLASAGVVNWSLRANNGGASDFTIFQDSTERIRIHSTGNFGIGTGASDSGQRLQVTGDTLLKGSGNTSATTALLVENSDGTDMLIARNDRTVLLGNITLPTEFNIGGGAGLRIYQTSNSTTVNESGQDGYFIGSTSNTNSQYNKLWLGFTPTTGFNTTSGSSNIVSVQGSIIPTSGNAIITALRLSNVVNQTGGANGITRGLYVNPTLTAAADWRAIEWSNNSGWGLYGAGTANNYLRGNTAINTTTIVDAGLTINQTINGSNVVLSVRNDFGAADNEVSIKMIAGSTDAGEKGTILSHVRQGTGGAAFIIKTNATLSGTPIEAGRFTQSQNLHLGTFVSDSGEKLQVTGTAKITGASTFTATGASISMTTAGDTSIWSQVTNAGGILYVGRDNAAGSSFGAANAHVIYGTGVRPIVFYTNSTERMRIDAAAGNVLINTTTSSGKLTVNGDNDQIFINTSGTFGSLYFNVSGNSRAALYVTNTATRLEGRGSDGLYFGGATSQSHVRITSAGNVGIGTVTPTGKFHVFNDANSQFYFQNVSGSNFVMSGTNASFVANSTSGDFPNFIIQTAGTSIGSLGANGTTNLYVGTATSSIPLLFNIGGTEGARVTATNRNFHIGTFSSDSGEKLQVNGTAKITGNLAVDTNVLFVDTTNDRVGIGIATPDAKLRVAGTANGTQAIFGSVDGRGLAISTSVISGTNEAGVIFNARSSVTSGTFIFQTDGTQRVQIDSTGLIINGGNALEFINSAANAVSAIRPTGGGTSVMSTNSNGLHIAVGTEAAGDLILASNNTERIRLSNEGWFSHINATNPSASVTDSYVQYSADVTAGNAAPHFRTENGAVIKLYQETTAVGNSTISVGGGSAVLDDTEFDGYTLRQIVKALRNQGILA